MLIRLVAAVSYVCEGERYARVCESECIDVQAIVSMCKRECVREYDRVWECGREREREGERERDREREGEGEGDGEGEGEEEREREREREREIVSEREPSERCVREGESERECE